MINNLATFANSGAIDLQDGAPTPDRSLNAPGAAFIGSGASNLALDVFLGGAASTADTLNVGSTAGSTSLLLHDVNAGGAGNTGPGGIVLVTTTGANAATAFSLATSRFRPLASLAIAICWLPNVLRTMSRPLDSEA